MSTYDAKKHLNESTIDEVDNWIIESQGGNVRAFELLYREYYQRLFLFCRRMTGSIGAAEELVQESFIKAWQAIASFRADSRFYTWLRTIASRAIIDRYRLKQEKIWQSAVELDEQHYSSQLSPEYQMDLDKLITLLPDGARTILVLYEIEGYGHKEIAKMMGIAEGTSKAQLSRARKLLRESYAATTE